MRERSYDEEPRYNWIVYATAMLLVGGLAGYVLSSATVPRPQPSTAINVTAPAGAPPAAMVDDNQLRAYRDILARDPKNFDAAVSAGNLLYDGKRYSEAIPYYQQALGIRPSDINVSTDLGTALWYSGHPDQALAQYEKSLAIDANHAQTLFNVGIVKSDGKRDYAGAAAAWDTLLAKNPLYPNAANVRTMIADARAKAGVRAN